jgi:hypothetical protein
VAALDALVAIGGPVAAATRLSAPLPRATVLALLRHPEPAVPADACRCARPGPETAEVLIDLANDLNLDVAMAALCALGGMGRTEARPALKRLIREAPSTEMIDALASVTDEEGVILLARVGRWRRLLMLLLPVTVLLAANVTALVIGSPSISGRRRGLPCCGIDGQACGGRTVEPSISDSG